MKRNIIDKTKMKTRFLCFVFFLQSTQCKLLDFYHSKPKVITLCRNVYCRSCDGTGVNQSFSNNNNKNNNTNGTGNSRNLMTENQVRNLSNYRNGRNMHPNMENKIFFNC